MRSHRAALLRADVPAPHYGHRGLFEALQNLPFTTPVKIAFTCRAFARNRIRVGEMIDVAATRFENDFLIALETREGTVSFRFHVCGHGLTI